MRYRFPRSRIGKPTDELTTVLHTASLISDEDETHHDVISKLVELRDEDECSMWMTPISAGRGPAPLLTGMPALNYDPSNPEPLSDFTVLRQFPSQRTKNLGYRRWGNRLI